MSVFSILFIFSLLLISCDKQEGEILSLSEEPVGTVLYLSGGDVNHRGVAVYAIEEEEATFLASYHFRSDATLGTPRGIFGVDGESFLVALDGADRIEHINYVTDEVQSFALSPNLNGNVYGLDQDSNGYFYTTESNRFERFDSEGIQDGNSFLVTTIGSCVLNSPRQFLVTGNDELIVTSYNNHRILVYDVSGATPTCLSSTPSAANNPYGVLLHSDGSLYYGTFSDDQIYRADPDGSNPVAIWSTDTSVINNPSAIIELESGDLAIASSGSDAVEILSTSGIHLGTLIKDVHSLNITDMSLVRGAAQ